MSEASKSPSVFELIACDTLKRSLREAIRYLLNYLKQNHSSFNRLPPTDETVLLLDLLIEFNHLRSYRASYSERLYNLIRHSRNSQSYIEQIFPSLICLTIVPYLEKKVENYFDKINYKETRTADELRQLRIYRLFTRSASFINLLCMLRFAAGQSNYHNYVNCITGIDLKCKTLTVQNNSAPVIGSIDTNDDFGNNNHSSSKLIADFMGKALTYGSYIIQFLDFWNTHSNSTPLFSASLHIPKPPPKSSKSRGIVGDNIDDDIPRDLEYEHSASRRSVTMKRSTDVLFTDEKSSNICLICEHVRQNECALSNTGYVFCYSCIYKYVKTKQRCPITGNPASVDNIVKIYQDNSSEYK